MKKYCLDLRVSAVERMSVKHVLLKLTQEAPLPAMQPGQFVEVRVDHSPSTFVVPFLSIMLMSPTMSCGSWWPPLAAAPARWGACNLAMR